MKEIEEIFLLIVYDDIKAAKKTVENLKSSEKPLEGLVKILKLFTKLEFKACLSEISENNSMIKSQEIRSKVFCIKEILKAIINIINSKLQDAIRDLNELKDREQYYSDIVELLIKHKNWPLLSKKKESIQELPQKSSFQNLAKGGMDSQSEEFAKLYRENSEVTENSKWFVVSTSWFSTWSKQSGISSIHSYPDLPFYHILCKSSEPTIGKIQNNDIINLHEKDELDSNSKYKNFLKTGLFENSDYVLLPEKAYKYLSNFYPPENEIPRFAIPNNSSSATVELYIKKILFVFFNKSKLERKHAFIGRNTKLEETVKSIFKFIGEKKFNPNQVKIWKINSEYNNISKLEQFHKKKPGEYFEGCSELNIDSSVDNSLISDTDYVFCDISIKGNTFVIMNTTNQKCKNCTQTERIIGCLKCKSNFCEQCISRHKKCNLNNRTFLGLFSCFSLKKNFNNNEASIIKNKREANSKVANSADPITSDKISKVDSEKKSTNKKSLLELETTASTFANSLGGLSLNPVGLQNLGNTCFMNSALQCLAHCEALTRFLLNPNLSEKINKSNPLGTKGKLAMAYSELLSSIFNGKERSVAPWLLKKTIASVASQFEGYQQHDSHEFLSYLIAGLHEDLNEVKKKPYHSNDIKYEDDNQASKESWNRHISRNKSIIVDLMYGQYKSDVCCPRCHKHSFTFDPFNSITLPIPWSGQKSIEVNYVKSGFIGGLLKVNCSLAPNCTILEAKKFISRNMGNEVSGIKVFDLKHKVPNRELDDNEIFVKARDWPLFFYEVQENSQVLCFVIIGIEGTPDEFPCRVLGINSKITITEMISKISDELIPVYKELYNENSQPSPRIMAFSSSYIECFICDTGRCEKLCQVKSSNKPVSSLLGNRENLYIKVFVPKTGKNNPGYEKMKEFTKSKSNSADGSTSIQDCFRAFSLPDTLDEKNSWYCPNCKKHVQATKKMEIFKAPPILVIHLKRFKSTGHYREKITIPIRFPIENLDISEFVKGQNSDLYDLFAVSNHFGTLAGGHYTATVLNSVRGKWYDCNDSSVSEVNEISETASYILFYRAKSSRKFSNSI